MRDVEGLLDRFDVVELADYLDADLTLFHCAVDFPTDLQVAIEGDEVFVCEFTQLNGSLPRDAVVWRADNNHFLFNPVDDLQLTVALSIRDDSDIDFVIEHGGDDFARVEVLQAHGGSWVVRHEALNVAVERVQSG